MDDGRRVFPLWRHVRFKTSVKLRSTPLPRVDGARPLTGAAAYQRRGTYPPPRIRFSFQTSPHRTHRQYDVALGRAHHHEQDAERDVVLAVCSVW